MAAQALIDIGARRRIVTIRTLASVKFAVS
jgi:hypothetical protein